MPVIIRDLTDNEMIQFMDRENPTSDDSSPVLETWEAAAEFTPRPAAGKNQSLVIARLLGWTRTD